MANDFRRYLPDLNSGKFKDIRSRSALSHAKHLYDEVALVRQLDSHWRTLYAEEFRGITSDGDLSKFPTI
jgi:hypothetical protein